MARPKVDGAATSHASFWLKASPNAYANSWPRLSIGSVMHTVIDASAVALPLLGQFLAQFRWLDESRWCVVIELNGAAGQAELGVGQQHQPGPAIGLLGVPDARRGPVERLLAEAVGMLQIEAMHIGAPEHGQRRRPGAAPPQPEALGNPGLARQPFDLDQHQRSADDGARRPTALVGVVVALGVHAGQIGRAHLPVLRVLLLVLRTRRPPTPFVVAAELLPMPLGAADLSGVPPLGIGIEAAPPPQPHQH